MPDILMQTFTGKLVRPLELTASDVCIEDIAHHLALLNRYNGATRYPYSVAQHSILVSRRAPQEHALYALLHDAQEAYLGDIIRPLKDDWEQIAASYADAESRAQVTILDALGVDWSLSGMSTVAQIDRAICGDEARELLVSSKGYGDGVGAIIKPMHWTDVKRMFLKDFEYLKRKQDLS